jgi:hypothetical protein
VLVLVDLVDHSVSAASCGVQSGELALQATADSVRVLDEGYEHELDDRCGGALR